MKNYLRLAALAAVTASFAGEAVAETTWNVSLWGKRRAFTEHVEKLAELVSAKTNGDFKLNISYGGLSKNKENLDGISIGAFEMAQFCSFYHKGKNPTITVTELPFSKDVSLARVAEIYSEVFKHPAVVKDLARWNATLLMPTPLPQYNVIAKGDAPKTLADFKGLRVRGPGGIMGVLGKLVKAVAFAPHAHMAFGTVETGKWWTTNLNPGTVNCPVVANTDALNSLSDDHKAALLGSIDESLDYYIETYNGKTMDAWGPKLAEKGIESVTYGDGELASFKEAVAGPAAAAWIADNTAKGLPGQELYDLVTGMVAN